MAIYALRYISNDVASNATSNVYKYSPNSEDEVAVKGVMHAQITVIGQEEIQSERIAKFVWDTIVDTYYYSDFTTVIDTLKSAVEQGSKKAAALIKNDNNGDINLSFALSVFKGRGVYITVFGEQQVYVYKNGGIVKVSQIISQNKGVVASMAWSDSDLLMMASPKLLEGINDIVEMGDLDRDVVKKIDNFSRDLKAYESILLLSNKDYAFKGSQPQPYKESEKVEETIKKEPVLNNLQKVEVIDEANYELEEKKQEDKDNLEESVSDEDNIIQQVKQERKFNLALLKNVNDWLKKTWSNLYPKLVSIFKWLKRIPDFFYSIFTKVFHKLNVLLLDKYGRTQWYKRIMSKVSLSNFGKNKGGVGMKIDGYKEVDLRKKRFATLFFIILGIIAIIGLYRLGVTASNQRKENKEASQVLQVLEDRVNQADKVRLTDTEEAQNVMFTIVDEELITKLDAMKLSDADYIKYGNLKKKFYEIDDSLNNRQRVSEDNGGIEVFLDGRAEFGESVNLTDITTYKDDFQNEFIIAVDNGNKAVYMIRLDNKNIKTLGNNKVFDSPKYIDYGVAGMYVYDDQKGMMRARFSKSGTVSGFSVIAGLNKDVLGEFEFADLAIITSTDNVYLLSPQKQSIYRSIGSGVGYQYPTEYITAKSFAKSFNLANDISIYVTTSGERGVERYSYDNTKGVMALNRVAVEGVDGTIGNITAAYTAALEDSSMYVFDSGLYRVLKFEKPIERGSNSLHPNQLLLTSQYIYNGKREDIFKEVKEIAADYNEKFLYILDSNKILKLKIK